MPGSCKGLGYKRNTTKEPGIERVPSVRPLVTTLLSAICLVLMSHTPAYGDARTPVSCDVISQDIRAVLRDLAAQAEVNVAIDDTVQNRITVRLKEVPFEDALRILASSAGFEVKEDTGVFLVQPLSSGASYPGRGV